MSTPEEIRAYYSALGMRMIEGFDRKQMLGIIREQRRRHASQDGHKALAELAGLVRGQMRKDLPDTDPGAVVDALLEVTSLLGTFVAAGVDGQNALNAIAYLADDMAKEVGW